MARGSTTSLYLRKHLQMPYHKLDQIREDDDPDDKLNLFKSYEEDEEQEDEEEEKEELEDKGDEHHQQQEEALAARVQALRNKILAAARSSRSSYSPMYRSSSSRGLRVGGSYVRRRKHRWRRMRLRLCRVRLISWLSPVEFLKKLRRAYIQAISSSKESQCSLVMMGSPWSFPVVVPFRG